MKYPVNIETERISIRPLTIADTKLWEAFVMDEVATTYIPSYMKGDASHAKTWIEKQLERYQQNRFGLEALTLKSTGEFIGQCGLLKQIIDGKDEVEIGYHLLPDYWGNGYASEAAQAFKQLGFDHFNCESIVSIIDVGNEASQKVAERNGMRKEKQTIYFDLDVCVYRIDKSEFDSSTFLP